MRCTELFTTALLALGLALGLAACGDRRAPEQTAPASAPPAAAPSLESAVAALLASSDLAAAVDELKLPPAGFDAVLVPSYHRLFAAYLAKYNDEADALVPELARLRAAAKEGGPAIAVRRHYAGDPEISLAQGRVRWAQPVQSESWRVSIGDAPLDAVWVSYAGRWYLLLGLDEAALSALAAMAPQCAAAARLAGAPGPCSDAAWMAIDGALREDADRVARACDRAAHLCVASSAASAPADHAR